MQEREQVRKLMAVGKYRDAGVLLDSLLRKEKKNDEIWYLRGILSLKLKNYEHAHECFEQALWLNKKTEYYKIRGMAHMENFEIDAALVLFENALKLNKNDASLYFFIAVCYLLIGDPRSEDYFKVAWKLNKKITRELIKNFYDTIIKPDFSINKKLKEEIEKELEKLV